MFRRILIPLDGSELSERILLEVEPLLRRVDTPVELLTVVTPTEGWSERPEDHPEDRQFALRLEESRRYLGEIVEKLEARGVDASCEVATGDPADAILKRIEQSGPSLVAMATHGRSGIARWVRGSVAERVLRYCPAPLLMINTIKAAADEGRRSRFRRILVPLDGSKRAASILPIVEQLAGVCESEVVLMRVGSSRLVAAGAFVSPEVAPLVTDRELEDSPQPYRARLEQSGLAVRTKVGLGSEATRILDAIDEEEIDLLAMTTHGYTGMDRWLFGSLAEKVLRDCRKPILIRRTWTGEED